MTLHIPRSGAHPILAFSLITLVLVTGLLATAFIARGPQAAAPPVVGIASDMTAKRLYDDYSASQAYIRSLDATVAALQADMDALTDAICREGYAVVRVDGELTVEKPAQQQRAAPAPDGWNTAVASWYGPGFYGNTTAHGDVLTEDMMNVAHRSLPFGTRIEFEYDGRRAVAVVNDRGPFAGGRTFDLGPGTARALGFSGVQTVRWRVL